MAWQARQRGARRGTARRGEAGKAWHGLAWRGEARQAGRGGAGSYTSISEAIRVVDYRQQLMEQATRDLDAYRVKYALLSDLTGWGAALHAARLALEKALEAGKKRSKEKAEAGE